ncbi:hypothetical protein PCLA_03f0676 [Pseudomonas citronellolis]|nr:hypothetical protein PCLA_03f0676 [Pseudomonas citronellolis]
MIGVVGVAISCTWIGREAKCVLPGLQAASRAISVLPGCWLRSE